MNGRTLAPTSSPGQPSEIGALAVLAAARAVTPKRPRDPLEYLAWVESGAPFEEAGISGFMEGMPRAGSSLPGATVASLLETLDRVKATPLLGHIYMKALPRMERHAAGSYFTPPWLAALALDRAGFDGSGVARLVDPMCGAGVFLVEAIGRVRRASPSATKEDIARRVHGVEVDPLTALLARASWLMATAGAPRERGAAALCVPVACADAILGATPDDPFDVVAGNPPWVGWESLSEDYRRATRPLWERYGLFSAGDPAARMQHLLGRGRKDLSMLATFVAADRWLVSRGRLAFVLPRTLFQMAGSAEGFRRLNLAGAAPLGAIGIDDVSARRPFGPNGAPCVVAAFEKGRATRWPVSWSVWSRNEEMPTAAVARPIDDEDAGSPWMVARAGRVRDLRGRLGRSAYRARAGAYTGGANGVYWVRLLERRENGLCRVENLAEAGLRSLPRVEALVEGALLFPLLRARDLKSAAPTPSAWILLPQDPQARQGIDLDMMARQYPRALAYLESFREALAARRDRGTRALIEGGSPFYTLFSVSVATLAPWKVVWSRIASRVSAHAIGPHDGRPVIPQETCSFIACRGGDEAQFLAALLSSDLFHEIASSFSQPAGKSFGAPHLLERIAVPAFKSSDPTHAALARTHAEEANDPSREAAVAAAWPPATLMNHPPSNLKTCTAR